MIMQKQTDAVTKQRGAAKTQPPKQWTSQGQLRKTAKRNRDIILRDRSDTQNDQWQQQQ